MSVLDPLRVLSQRLAEGKHDGRPKARFRLADIAVLFVVDTDARDVVIALPLILSLLFLLFYYFFFVDIFIATVICILSSAFSA